MAFGTERLHHELQYTALVGKTWGEIQWLAAILEKKIICNVPGQSASVQDQASKVSCVSLKVKLKSGITVFPEQVRSCSKSVHGTRMFLSAFHLPFAHLSLKSHGFYSSWMSMFQICMCSSVACGFCWWFTVIKIQNVVLHLSPQCIEIICLEDQEAH